MDKGTLITIGALALVLISVGLFTLSSRGGSEDITSEAARTLGTTPDSAYTDLQGNPFTFDEYEGKVRIVNSWASWCPFCVQELIDFETLALEFAQQDVTVIAINRKESKELASSFLKTLGEFNNVIFVQDETDAFYNSIGGFSMPETVFYDSNGNITTHKRGFMTLEEMRTLTEKALNATNEG